MSNPYIELTSRTNCIRKAPQRPFNSRRQKADNEKYSKLDELQRVSPRHYLFGARGAQWDWR
jgi:hypothetical protein